MMKKQIEWMLVDISQTTKNMLCSLRMPSLKEPETFSIDDLRKLVQFVFHFQLINFHFQ